MTRRWPARAALAAVNAVGVTVYYASPDLVASRPARAALKTGLMAGLSALSVVDLRATRTPEEAEGLELLRAGWSSRTAAQKAALAALGVAAATGGTAAVVVAERWVYRIGERRTAAGARRGHLPVAVAMGAVSGLLSLVPPGKEV